MDLKIITDMLDRARVVYEVDKEEDGRITVTIEAKTGPNNEGYPRYVSILTFSPSTGELLTVGAWE